MLHLPAPHIWQLAPASSGPSPDAGTVGAGPALVVTVEVHVRKDMDDAGVLELTRWSWERCAVALRAGRARGEEGVEVTVGVVRG